jgi:hypothetical protein
MVFNRPEMTRRVLTEIAKARPQKLFVVADGARDRDGERELCQTVRDAFKTITWDCELHTNFSEVNLGCARRISSGIDWVFENVEEAIFLEDDCLPHPTFFRFCDEMLEHFRHNERIMTISGDNFQFGSRQTEYSYYFSRYAHIWGWASWRRAWKYYDFTIARWPALKEAGWLYGVTDDKREARYWTGIFDKVYRGSIGTWDYQWVFASWLQSGFTVIPNVNLISNIGFGAGATHTGDAGGKLAEMSVEEMAFPLLHPPEVVRNSQADRNTAKLFFRKSLLYPIKQSVRQFLG